MKRLLRSMLALGVLALSGCDNDPAGPVSELPEPELVSFLYACGTWVPQIDPSTVVLADLHVGEGASRPELASAVRDRGGRIVHQYEVGNMLRAVVRAGDIPGLPVWSASGVTNAESTELKVLILYSRTPTEADAQALRARGGRDVSVLAEVKVIVVTVPDAAIPGIEQLSGVRHVEANAPACLN